jgi:DUF3087 family protein
MPLQSIDKTTYRKRLNRVIVVIVIILLVSTLGSSTILIELFGEPGGSNFTLNLIGLGVGASIIGLLIYRYNRHPYLYEVMYVWRLKQELNRIYRKTAKLKLAVEENNPNALVIMNFNLRGSEQLYELDDNDLTLSELKIEINNFDTKVQALGLSISTDDYHKGLLNQLG